MYYIYTPDFTLLDDATQYAIAVSKAKHFAQLRGEALTIYYNTNYKKTITPNN